MSVAKPKQGSNSDHLKKCISCGEWLAINEWGHIHRVPLSETWWGGVILIELCRWILENCICLTHLTFSPSKCSAKPSQHHISIWRNSIILEGIWGWELEEYYGLNTFVTPKLMCWNLNAQCDGMRRWGLREVLRRGEFRFEEWD